jgi:hypothetical protein
MHDLDRESSAMDRFELASEQLSSARRHLFSAREEGEEESFRAALRDARVGLEMLGDSELHSAVARDSVSVLREALGEVAPDRQRTSMAVDRLASLLYWTEAAAR